MKKPLLFSLIATGAFSFAQAAVITPTLGSLVDPAGAQSVDSAASGSTALATFNAQTGLNVLQAFDGMDGGTVHIVSLSGLPDIRLTMPGTRDSGASGISDDDTFNSSPIGTAPLGEAYAFSGTNGQSITIEFGTWNGSTFSADQAVTSAGLTFLNFGGAYNTASDQTIVYRDSSLNALSTQVFAGGADNGATASDTGGADFFSGYISGSQNIARIEIAITRNSGSSDIAIDDLGFTVVPEPSTYALIAGSLALLSIMLRRRRA